MEKANAPTSEEQLISLIGEKAHNLFDSGELWCSEAVLATLNQGLGGGLAPHVAQGLTVGMGAGLGGSGCLCGAVNGAVVALGLFLAGCDPNRRIPDKAVRAHTKELTQAFSSNFGATCCRILTRKDSNLRQSKHQRCAGQTAFAAEFAARIILARRPELVPSADLAYLSRRQNRAARLLKMISGNR